MNIKQASVLLSRFALFVIYFWFGLLKVIGQSPASPLVQALFEKTIHGILPFSSFIVLFGLFEMAIGVLFFIPKLERVAVTLLGVHLFTTVMPLFLVKGLWMNPLVPSLEGQYIIKNLALIACAFHILVDLDNNKTTRTSDTLLTNL